MIASAIPEAARDCQAYEESPMSRTTRLQDLIRVLRHHPGSIGGPELAARLGMPLRTLYQDIAARALSPHV